MTLSFGTLAFAFSPGYHRRNRLAKLEGRSLWFDVPAAAATLAKLAGFRAAYVAGAAVPFAAMTTTILRQRYQARKPAFMQQQPHETEFGIAEARRVLGEVFAPWVMDLNLSIERFDVTPPADAADWQPGAILRLPFSERLCRNGGTVSGQALMAFADTAMVIANLAANRGYRPMTTVDQTTHFMRAVSASDVLADARVVRLGRTMSFGRVTLLGATDNKPVAMVSSAFAML
jgi:uncharacterized protein (TIGR00369 family)